VRLIFSYEGDTVRLESSERLETTTPPSDPVEGVESEVGFWLELRDSGDRRLYRRVMQNPISADAEVFSDDPERSIARIEVEKPVGAFTALVPDLPDATQVALVGSAPGEPAERAVTTEIARFDLRPTSGGEAEP
jgi:hypothetical protein